MSFELFPQENANVLASFGATQRRDPGVFDNFFPSAGNAIMRGFAETGRAVSMLGAVGPMLQDTDKYGQRGTEAVDKYFKRHDDIWNRAVEYWTPKRSEVGVAGEVVGQLLGTIPLLVASPAALVAKTQMSTGEDLVRKGVDADKAGAVGAVQAAGLGLGVWLPVLGKTLAQRVVIGGAGFNAVQGAATRGVSGAILEGTKAADEFKAFDPTAVTLDVLLGLAFGGIAHLSPAQRAQGEAAWSKIAEWTGTFKPSDIDALVTLKQAEHLNVESAPGRMASAEDIAKHHAAMKQAVDDLLNDRPVDVGMLTEGAKFLPDAERIAFGKTIADELNAQAKGMVEADMLAQVARMEAEGKPGFIRSAEELLALKAATESPVLHPDLERAIEISRRPGFLRSAEEKLVLDAVLQGRASDVIGLPDGMKAGPEAETGVNKSTPAGESGNAPDPIRAAADQFVAERPDLTLTIGADQNGQPITISAAKYLEDARLDTELAAQDAGLFEVAASCMLRG